MSSGRQHKADTASRWSRWPRTDASVYRSLSGNQLQISWSSMTNRHPWCYWYICWRSCNRRKPPLVVGRSSRRHSVDIRQTTQVDAPRLYVVAKRGLDAVSRDSRHYHTVSAVSILMKAYSDVCDDTSTTRFTVEHARITRVHGFQFQRNFFHFTDLEFLLATEHSNRLIRHSEVQ